MAEDRPSTGRRSDRMSMAEKINNLHEAYQFLVKKYIPDDHLSMDSEAEKIKAAAKPKEDEPSNPTDSYIDFSHLHV